MSDKISPSLIALQKQGALTASVIITFDNEEDRESFKHEDFDQNTTMKSLPALTGSLKLESLQELGDNDTIVKVEPNHNIELPTDPSEPC